MGPHGEPSRQRRMNGDLPPAGRSWTPQARSMAPAAAPGLPVSSPMWCRLSPHSVYRSITRVSVSFCGVGKRFQFGPACVTTGMSCCFRTRRTCGMPMLVGGAQHDVVGYAGHLAVFAARLPITQVQGSDVRL